MSTRVRRLATLIVAIFACVLPAGSAQAHDTGNNTARAIATIDGSRVFDFAWDVTRQRGTAPVDNRNTATAHSTCLLQCTSTAIAFQIVLVSGSPRTVVPVNVADAQNTGCTGCVAAAEAFQWVRVFPAGVRFTATGRATLADVRRQLRALEFQELSLADLHAAVVAQAQRVDAVLANELVLWSDPDTEADLLRQRTLRAADRV